MGLHVRGGSWQARVDCLLLAKQGVLESPYSFPQVVRCLHKGRAQGTRYRGGHRREAGAHRFRDVLAEIGVHHFLYALLELQRKVWWACTCEGVVGKHVSIVSSRRAVACSMRPRSSCHSLLRYASELSIIAILDLRPSNLRSAFRRSATMDV